MVIFPDFQGLISGLNSKPNGGGFGTQKRSEVGPKGGGFGTTKVMISKPEDGGLRAWISEPKGDVLGQEMGQKLSQKRWSYRWYV